MNVKRRMILGMWMMAAMQATAVANDWYVPGSAITQVNITEPADGARVPLGGTLTVSCSTATDTDIKKNCRLPDQNVSDPVTHFWSGPGSFDPGTGTSVTWTAPTSPGDATLTVTANDSPLADESPTTDSVTVTVVGVWEIEYLQYPELGGVWTDVPEPMYVMKGTTVTFKAWPSGGPWPSGKPVWGGSAGASGTGETKAVTFNEIGDKTVTAECGNTVTVNVRVYELTGYHVAQDDPFSGRATTKYGVGERVYLSFTVNPSDNITPDQMGGLLWQLVQGDGIIDSDPLNQGLGVYTAPSTESTVTLRLTVLTGPSSGKYVEMGFTVVKPSGLNFIQKPNTGIWHEYGSASVGFKGWSYLLPKDVSFCQIQFTEGTCTATIENGLLNGWFATKYPDGLTHPPSPAPIPVDFGNIATGCRVLGTDTCSTCESPPPPWAAGWFQWDIPDRYTAFYGPGGWIQFDTAPSKREVDAAGKMTIQKKGVGPFSKNIDDPNSSY